MHTHCPECQTELVSNEFAAWCPKGCPPYCLKCGKREVEATGVDFYCPDCPTSLKELFAKAPKPKPAPMEYPGVAVGVIVLSGKGILLGKRKGPLGAGEYSLPGGKVDFGESPVQAAIREVKEETNLDVFCVEFTGKVSNDYFPENGKQYINLFYVATATNPEELQIAESEKEKFEEWLWFSLDALPSGIWLHTHDVIRHYFFDEPCKIDGIDG
jgi:8-oxo-dGTP diphosphatase